MENNTDFHGFSRISTDYNCFVSKIRIIRKQFNLWKILLFSFLFFNFSFVNAQDFGFGFDFDEEESSSFGLSVNASGDVSLEFPFYFQDFDFLWEEIASANVNLNLSTKYLEAITSFYFSYDSFKELGDWDTYSDSTYTPLIINEVFLRAFVGPVNIEAGYRKLNWGKADSSGPLDVTNPVDFSDLRNIMNMMECKIARPMVHVTWNTGSFSKLEGVFIPNFAPHRFASEGRWMPSQISNYESAISSEITSQLISKMGLSALSLASQIQSAVRGYFYGNDLFGSSDTGTLEYFQTGLRYTTTIGSMDIGGQYYYGNTFRPVVTINGIQTFVDDIVTSGGSSITPSLISPSIKYTRYHQIGVDYAQVLFGLNVRAELALNLTEDIDGTDGSLQNPFIAWSFGFDRDLFWGINLNIQCNETIRLFNSKVGDNPILDCEAGTNVTYTRLTTQLSKMFLRDNLEVKNLVIWDIENKDCYIIPQVIYTYKNLTFNLTAGFFSWGNEGELGQYHRNNFIRFGISYSF